MTYQHYTFLPNVEAKINQLDPNGQNSLMSDSCHPTERKLSAIKISDQ